MALIIDKNTCCGCGVCAGNCPVNAISECPDGKYEINPDICVECQTCVNGCPTGSIS